MERKQARSISLLALNLDCVSAKCLDQFHWGSKALFYHNTLSHLLFYLFMLTHPQNPQKSIQC
jgi:hypothetical protein